jgi:hypothetical protein
MSIIRTDAEARTDATASRKLDYVICPLGGEDADGMPVRIYVDGKVLKLKAN